MNNKLLLLIVDIKDFLKKVLERNILILLLSTVVFVFLFFTKNGIIHQYYLYNLKKESLEYNIAQKKQELEILNKKTIGLNENNVDVMEEVIYLYQNKDPYLNSQKIIVEIHQNQDVNRKK